MVKCFSCYIIFIINIGVIELDDTRPGVCTCNLAEIVVDVGVVF
jgi:hypothetical protein